MADKFRVGVTRDMLDADGTLGGRDMALELLDGHSYLEWEFMPEDADELTAAQVRGYDAILDGGRRVTEATLEGADRLALVARFGAGFDVVDVDACTRAGVVLTTAPDGVRRPVASSFMAFILALSHNMMPKDRLTRKGAAGQSDRPRGRLGWPRPGPGRHGQHRPRGLQAGCALRDAPRHLRSVRHPEQAAEVGAEVVDLETLMRTADFVCVSCPLNDETYHLIDEERLAMMKESAFLINVARGPIVDQKALTRALRERRIRGAGLDVFEREPIDPDDPILSLDNVIVSPHNLCMTDQCWRGIGESAVRSILEVAAGEAPRHLVINKEVLDAPGFREKLHAYASRA